MIPDHDLFAIARALGVAPEREKKRFDWNGALDAIAFVAVLLLIVFLAAFF